jgi:HAD superfamily hydrolase (TIGR01549 family)
MEFPKDIKAIIFDFDGTLFYMDMDWQRLNDELNEKFGQDTLTNLDLLDQNQRTEALAIITKAELESINTGLPVAYGLTTLQTLADKFKLAIVSRNTVEAIKAGLDKIGYKDAIVIVGKQDVKKLKPDPESLNTALSKLGIDAKEALYVGDTYHDSNAGHAAGVYTVIVHNPYLTFKPEGADKYIDKLNELLDVV